MEVNKIQQRLLVYLSEQDKFKSMFTLGNELPDLTMKEIHIAIEGMEKDGVIDGSPLMKDGKPIKECSYHINAKGFKFLKSGGYTPSIWQVTKKWLTVNENAKWLISYLLGFVSAVLLWLLTRK